MLKTALDGVVVMRLDGVVVGWNDVAVRTFGWPREDAIGRRMSELIIPHRYRAAHEAGLAHYLATGEGPILDTHFETEALHHDGHEVPVELSITRTDQFGEPVFLGFLRDITPRRESERRQAVLVGELNHRAKNLLGVVAGIAHQTARASTTIPDFERAFSGRLASLGRAHEILTAGAWETGSLTELSAALLGPYAERTDSPVSIAGQDVLLKPRHFLSLSMILHELTTNALKYGALSTGGGTVALSWRTMDDNVIVEWLETCTAPVQQPGRQGFGTRMIGFSVRHELGGQSVTEWRPGGLALTITFPVSSSS